MIFWGMVQRKIYMGRDLDVLLDLVNLAEVVFCFEANKDQKLKFKDPNLEVEDLQGRYFDARSMNDYVDSSVQQPILFQIV